MMASMMVRSEIELGVPATELHVAIAREAAESLTCDKQSVVVETAKEYPKFVVTSFSVPQARQMDVVDRIAKRMVLDMEDYQDQCICFPKSEAEKRRDQRKLERAKERRRQARLAREMLEKRTLGGQSRSDGTRMLAETDR